jgi:hypothetical protein
MLYREKPHFSPANCNNQLITVIEKGREVLDKKRAEGLAVISHESFPSAEPTELLDLLGPRK